MKCFLHPTLDAVASCKFCSRGLCPECHTEVGKSSACKNRCEAEVRDTDELVARAVKQVKRKLTYSAYFRSALFSMVCGLAFGVFGCFVFSARTVMFQVPFFCFLALFI